MAVGSARSPGKLWPKDGGERLVTAEELARISIVLLYVPVCSIVYWKLIRRLSASAKKLVTIMLVAQGLVIALSLASEPMFWDRYKFWSLDYENALPAYVATTQLALVGAVALLTAWLARQLPAWRRLYLMSLALIFFGLAREELIQTRQLMLGQEWVLYYATLGVAIAVATVLVAAKSPRRDRKWHICLLAGFATGMAGALLIEQFRFPEICTTLGFMSEAGGCQIFALEEALEFLGVWLTLVAMLGFFSDAPPRFLVRLFLYVFPPLTFVALILVLPPPHHGFQDIRREFSEIVFSFPLRFENKFLVQPISVEYESDVKLQAYRIDHGDRSLDLQFFASAANWHDFSGLGYSLHLVDQVSGKSVLGLDEAASRLHGFRLDRSNLYRQRMILGIPPQTPANRAYWVVLTLWREDGDQFARQKVVSSDLRLLNDTQIVLADFVIPSESAPVSPKALATFEGAFTLGMVNLPDRVHPAETLVISFNWRAENEGKQDYMQFLHLIHEASGELRAFDQPPLGARLPTRLWYSGLADSETWQIPLPADLTPGRYQVWTGLYRASDLARLPAVDADGAPYPDARVPLGYVMIESV